jgi:hypothetical protein
LSPSQTQAADPGRDIAVRSIHLDYLKYQVLQLEVARPSPWAYNCPTIIGRRQFITNRTARTQDNKNVGRKPVTHWHRREREKKRERERKLKGRKRREGGHGSAEARKAEGQAEM